MPHIRERYAQSLIARALSFSPIVGVLGQRQTGKTTLVSGLAKEYLTFDRAPTLAQAEDNPESFLTGRKHPFAVDECQLCPPLFPALKEHVRVHPRKGQFLVTGSVRFTSRRAIRESLTGRIHNVELQPLCLAESQGRTLPDFTLRLLEKPTAVEELLSQPLAQFESMSRQFSHFTQVGGLPGICFFRDEAVRAEKFESHLETLLERDLRLLIETTVPLRSLRALLSRLAAQQGQPLDLAATARASRVSVPTLRKLLAGFESMFLVRVYPTEGGEKKPVLFFEDQGQASHLLPGAADPMMDFIRGLHACLRPQFSYRPELRANFFQYRTRGGAWVPLAAKCSRGTVGFLPVLDESAPPAALATARSFLKAFPGSKLLILVRGPQGGLLQDQVWQVPFTRLI